MNHHSTDTPMHTILNLLRADRMIEAIKVFRSAYGGELMEAKNAIEAIRNACMPRDIAPNEYLVISRYEDGDDYQVSRLDSKEEAMNDARCIVEHRVEVAGARVIARSITTRY